MKNLINFRLLIGFVLGFAAAALVGVFAWFSLQPYMDFTSADPARVESNYESQNPAAYNEEEFKAEFLAAIDEAANVTGNDASRVQVVFHDNLMKGKALASVNYSPNVTVHSRIEVYLPHVREAFDRGFPGTARDIAHHEYGHVLQNHYVYENSIHGFGDAVYSVSYDHAMGDTHDYFHDMYAHDHLDDSEVFADCLSWSLDPGRWVGYMDHSEAATVCETANSKEAVKTIQNP